jgi:hypothetical protein
VPDRRDLAHRVDGPVRAPSWSWRSRAARCGRAGRPPRASSGRCGRATWGWCRRRVRRSWYYTLSISIHRVAEIYQVELSHSDPDSQAQIAPVRGAAAFDLGALRELELTHEQYGKTLARQVFADSEVAQRLTQVEAAAQTSSSFLRLLVCVDPSAQELQGLRWELLRHPRSGAALATSERVLLSRFMVSRDWRPVKLRARSELTALIAVSAPAADKLQRLELAPVDHAGEVTRVRKSLAGISVRTLGGPGAPFTLERLIDELRRGVDILYVVSHGVFQRTTGTPALILQDDAGAATAVKGEDLAVRLGELHARRGWWCWPRARARATASRSRRASAARPRPRSRGAWPTRACPG